MNDRIRFFQAAQHFANKAKNLASVQEVVLCGSMAAGDPDPGDIDLGIVLSHSDELLEKRGWDEPKCCPECRENQ